MSSGGLGGEGGRGGALDFEKSKAQSGFHLSVKGNSPFFSVLPVTLLNE